jgi:hypothetical protein
VWLTEFGPHYDSLNERVIPTYPKRRSHKALRDFSAPFLLNAMPSRRLFWRHFWRQGGLVADPFWRDHEASMTQVETVRMEHAGS